jgi:hypothetical protein
MLGHHQPRLLAARQHAAVLLDIVAGKAEAAGQRAQLPCPACGKALSSDSKIVSVAVQQVHRMLGEVAHLHAGADHHRALVRA